MVWEREGNLTNKNQEKLVCEREGKLLVLPGTWKRHIAYRHTQKHVHMHMFRVGQNHIYHIYMVCIRYFWQGNHQIYGHIRCIYTVLPTLPMFLTLLNSTGLKWTCQNTAQQSHAHAHTHSYTHVSDLVPQWGYGGRHAKHSPTKPRTHTHTQTRTHTLVHARTWSCATMRVRWSPCQGLQPTAPHRSVQNEALPNWYAGPQEVCKWKENTTPAVNNHSPQ